MEVNNVADFLLLMEEEDTTPKEVYTSEIKEPNAQRKIFVEVKLDNGSVKIYESTVAKKIHPGKEMDDEESKSSFR